MKFCGSLEQHVCCGVQVWVSPLLWSSHRVPHCSSYVLHCTRSRFHLPCIQAFSKLKFLLSCGARGGEVESLPRARSGILVSHRHHSSFSKFPTWHRCRFRPQEVLIQFTMHRLRSFFTFPHVTSKCFECCCCQCVSLSLPCCPACVNMPAVASG